jgi:hypothetical protein
MDRFDNWVINVDNVANEDVLAIREPLEWKELEKTLASIRGNWGRMIKNPYARISYILYFPTLIRYIYSNIGEDTKPNLRKLYSHFITYIEKYTDNNALNKELENRVFRTKYVTFTLKFTHFFQSGTTTGAKFDVNVIDIDKEVVEEPKEVWDFNFSEEDLLDALEDMYDNIRREVRLRGYDTSRIRTSKEYSDSFLRVRSMAKHGSEIIRKANKMKRYITREPFDVFFTIGDIKRLLVDPKIRLIPNYVVIYFSFSNLKKIGDETLPSIYDIFEKGIKKMYLSGRKLEASILAVKILRKIELTIENVAGKSYVFKSNYKRHSVELIMPFIVLLPEIIEILNNIPDLSAKVNEISQKLMSLLKLFVFGLINDNEKSIIEEIEKIYEIIDQVQMMFNESALMGNREYDKLLEKLYESFENVLRRKNLILL